MNFSLFQNSVFNILLVLFIIFLAYMLRQHKKSLVFNKRLITALILGVVFGALYYYFLNTNSANPGTNTVESLSSINDLLSLLSGAYFQLLKMLVVPLILFSIISSILNFTGTENNHILSRVASKSVFLLLLMTSLAAGISMLVGMYLNAGSSLIINNIDANYQPLHHYQNLADNLLAMLPSNPIQAMTEQNTVAIVILAVLIGVAGLMVYKTEKSHIEMFKTFINSVFSVIKQITRIVINLTPYGVFALIAELTANNGANVFANLALYIAAMFLAMLLVIAIIHLPIVLSQGYSPIRYFKLAYAPLLVAFTTRSSFATLPVTEETLRTKFKTRQLTASFVPSMGATLGMSACAGVFPAMVVCMTMHVLHQPITTGVILKVMIVNAIASLGISGIPGTAFVAASAALNLLGLPYFMLGVVQSVDPLVDMGRTATNVNGVLTAGLFADTNNHSEEQVE